MSFALNPRLALVICIVVPILALAIAVTIRIASPRYTVMQNKLDSLNNEINETITNERVIKSFVREEHEKQKFAKVNDALMDKSISALKMMILMQPISALAINITTLAVVWIAGRSIMIGGMQIGTLTAFITYLSQILTALNFVANIILQGTRAAASDRRITEVLNAKVDLNDDRAACRDRTIERGEIEFCDVSFRYFKHNTEPVLDHVRLHLPAGAFVGIVGSTGSGKTSLVQLLQRLYTCTAGEIDIDGVNINDIEHGHLRKNIGIVLQEPFLYSRTIMENIRMIDPRMSEEQVHEAARIACVHDVIEGFENGYDTVVGERGVTLSGGQKQRVAIARMLMQNAPILIFDDSMSAVDTETDASIRAALKHRRESTTTFIISHRITTLCEADKILVLEHGRLVEQGTHEELIAKPGLYRRIARIQNALEEELKQEGGGSNE